MASETPSFDFDSGQPAPNGPWIESSIPVEVDIPRAVLLEQIVRDSRVLREDPIYHVPSREFYERRIAQYRALL